MAITLDEFIQSITSSGLMDSEEIESFLDTLPMEHRPRSAEDLAKEMHRQGKLTTFQAHAIYQKKTRGLVVGNYVVLDKLGRGGMGAVYKAQHKRMKRVVALKMLPSAATKSPDAVKRFQREVEAAAKLSHPNIVTAHDADEAKGVHFLVMEYVEGQDLYALVKGTGTLSVARAVDYMVQAATGLEYAHSQGIIHRDIKPGNLLLDKKGTVKILDMGLARFEEAVAGTGGTADEGLTQSGQVMGTLDYMPPEQALDTRTVDLRADIYSLGCTLHYLLTGRPPFGGDTLGKKIIAHREHPIPSLRKVRSDVPESLDAVFQKMMAKLPEDRQQSMTEVISQLHGCTLQGGNAPVSFPPSSSHYAETVDFQREDTAPPVLGSSPLDDLFASEPVQITERLIVPFRRYRKRWTKHQKVLVASMTVGVAAFFLLFLVIAKTVQSPSTADRMESPSAAAKKPVESGRVVVPRSEVPPSAVAPSVAEKAKPENLQPKVVPVEAASRPSNDLGREAAQWVLRNGGTVGITLEGKAFVVKSLAELPHAPFILWECNLSGNGSIGDEVFERLKGLGVANLCLAETRVTGRGLEGMQSAEIMRLLFLDRTLVNDATFEQLEGMTNLERLSADSTAVSDAGLEHLSGLVKLKWLWLNKTRITDSGLRHLRGMKSLEVLSLAAMPLTDAGLEHLRELKSLQDLSLPYTGVTDTGLKCLAGLPHLTFLEPQWNPSHRCGSGTPRTVAAGNPLRSRDKNDLQRAGEAQGAKIPRDWP